MQKITARYDIYRPLVRCIMDLIKVIWAVVIMKNDNTVIEFPKNAISGKAIQEEKIVSAFGRVLFFVMGIFVSRGYILSDYSPFAAALIASVPRGYILSALSGTCIGYILPAHMTGSMRYVSTMIAVAAIRWTLLDVKPIKKYDLFQPLISFIPMLATGLALNSVDGFSVNAVGISIAESVLTFISTYFFAGAFKILTRDRWSTFSKKDIVCMILTYCIAILSLANVKVMSTISLGRILAITSILICAYVGSIFGGSVMGGMSGAIFSLTSTGAGYLSGVLTLGGILSGVFSVYGRVAVAGSFIFVNLAVAFMDIQNVYNISLIYEVMIATILFSIVPQKFLNFISRLFKSQVPNSKLLDGIRKSSVIRFRLIGKALSSVRDSIDEVSQKLAKLKCKDKVSIVDRVVLSVCKNCARRELCFGKEKVYSWDQLMFAINECLQSDIVDAENDFIQECQHSKAMKEKIISECEVYKMNQSSVVRANEVKDIVSSQILGMGEIFSDFSDECDAYECFDMEVSGKVTEIFHSKGIVVMDAVCRLDRDGHMCIEVETAYANPSVFKSNKFIARLNRVIGREFDIPSVAIVGDRCLVRFHERTRYVVEVGTAQHVCHNGTLCGDCYEYFEDGVGKVVVILSDGMGTGGRAAVDGTMAADILSKLIKAGMSFKSALKIVNSALLVKSSDESLAAIDVVCIDLFTGEADFIKAGAPVSFVCREQNVVSVDAKSLPVGILSDIRFSSNKVQLCDGDLLLIMSDGALISGEDILKEKFSEYEPSKKSCQEFTEDLLDMIIANADSDFDDDISLIMLRVKRGD